jgi:hypothetical protein
VINVPVWVYGSDYMCCGTVRHLGDVVELDLTFAGDVEPSSDPDRIEVLESDRVVIVGAVVGPVEGEENHTDGTLIRSGDLEFAIEGQAPASHVQCSGHLYETRHGFPYGRTSGELSGICWLPEILRSVGDGQWEVDGFGPGEEHSSTEEWRTRPDASGSGDSDLLAWALVLTVDVRPDVARGSHDRLGGQQ